MAARGGWKIEDNRSLREVNERFMAKIRFIAI